jgi:hypothetical protein
MATQRQIGSVDVWFLNDFDPRAVLPVRLWRHAEATRYVVGLVATRPAWSQRGRRMCNGWVPLRWEDMTPLFGRSGTWNKIRECLLGRGVLECDDVYIVGEKAKWYRVRPEWWTTEVHPVTIRDERLSTRIQSSNNYLNEKRELRPPDHHIDRWLKEVRVDESKTRRWTCNRRHSIRQHLTALKIEALQRGDARVVVDAYGRVHLCVGKIIEAKSAVPERDRSVNQENSPRRA